MIENEKKSNTQLKTIVEQKDNNNTKQQQSSTNNSDPCNKCDDFKQLLDIEKQNNIQLKQQFQNQKKQTEEEINAKQVEKFQFKK